jgi:aspartate/methionine/tyrosine aminotransferase
MVPGPVQQAAAVALGDVRHVEVQRQHYWERLVRVREILAGIGVDCELPGGGFYLWVPAPGGDGWAWAHWLAEHAGLLVSPGSFYGESERATGYVRIAMVAPAERLELVARRLGG